MAVISSELAYERAMREPIHEQASYVQDVLGQKLVAYMVGIKDPKVVGRWARQENAPPAEREQRLRQVFRVAYLLKSVEANSVVRAWFMGMNPELDERSPAELIREGLVPPVVAAALAFVTGG